MNWSNLAICLRVYGILISEYSVGAFLLLLIFIGFLISQIFRTRDPKFTKESYREEGKK